MARVLQIRRGTAAQNDNFTGMPGELSFDTDAKTLRIHDGEMLGGYALMRADAVHTGDVDAVEKFDINSVPEEFWAATVRKHTPDAVKSLVSADCPPSATNHIDFQFTTDAEPYFVRPVLVCVQADAGYTPGDECTAFGIGDYAAPMCNISRENSSLVVRLMIGSQAFWVAHKTTGAKTEIANTKWHVRIKVYC